MPGKELARLTGLIPVLLTHLYTRAYLADQGRTPAEVAAWIVTEDLRREQAIDADLLARRDDPLADDRDSRGGSQASSSQVAHRGG